MMFDALRSAMGGWIAKIFIVLLGASFAVWGIADIFGGYGRAAIATVGETEVSNDAFRIAFQNQIQRISRQTGQGLTLEQARAFNIHGQVLGDLIAEATLDNDATDKGLGISERSIALGIVEDPTFRDSFGTFSRSAYEQFIAFSGLTEADFVNEQRKARTRRQLANALTVGIVAPQTMNDAFHRFNNETRIIQYVLIGPDSIEPVGTPDEAALAAFFEDNKAEFRAPEYRHIELIEADAGTIGASIEVSQDDIQALYESRAESIKIPEKRDVQQILFDNEQEAREAADKITAGADYALIGAAKGLSDTDISLGLVAAGEIFDPLVRDAAFALEAGEISQPIQGALGYVLLRIIKIELARTPPLEELRQGLREELAADLAQDRALDLFDAIEDDRAAGLTFPEIAAKNNVKYRGFGAVDSDGNDAQGTAIEVTQLNDVTSVAFNTDPGVEADPIQLADNGFLWVNVTDVIDSRDRTIGEVHDQLEERWRNAEQNTRMSEHAKMLVDRLNAGSKLKDIAINNGIQITTSTPLKRSSTDDNFDQSIISAIFATPKDGAGSALHPNGTDRIIFRVGDVALEPADPATEENKELAESLTLSISEDMLGTYVRLKQEKFGVTVNQNNLDILTGVSSDQGQY